MTHYPFDEWQKYVRNELDDNTREQLETHLYTCDKCLDHYLQAVEANESSLPTLSNGNRFTDRVMIQITVPDTKLQKKPFYQQAAFHYLLAAAATLFLMFSGVFQSLARYANSIDSQQVQERRSSVTEGVMNKTFAWMDSLEKKETYKK